MKKITSLLLVLVLFLSMLPLSGCSPKTDEVPDGGFDPYKYDDLTVFIDLPDYKNIVLKQVDIDEKIDRTIENAIVSQDIYEAVYDRPAAMRDKVTIDYVGFIDGNTFEGGSDVGASLVLGSGTFIPGFEEGVVGMMPGDVKDIALTFPKDYYEAFAGKDVVFSVTLKEVGAPPEINDEFAQKHSNYDTLAELRAAIAEDLKREMAFNVLLSSATLKDQPEEYKEHYESFVHYFSEQAKRQNLSLEDFIYLYGHQFPTYGLYYGISVTDFLKAAEEFALEYTLTELIMYSVLRAEGVTRGSAKETAAKEKFLVSYEGKTYDDLVGEYGEESVLIAVYDLAFSDILFENLRVV